jgi:hypothetical protein
MDSSLEAATKRVIALCIPKVHMALAIIITGEHNPNMPKASSVKMREIKIL